MLKEIMFSGHSIALAALFLIGFTLLIFSMEPNFTWATLFAMLLIVLVAAIFRHLHEVRVARIMGVRSYWLHLQLEDGSFVIPSVMGGLSIFSAIGFNSCEGIIASMIMFLAVCVVMAVVKIKPSGVKVQAVRF